jgi:hypothetical protein
VGRGVGGEIVVEMRRTTTYRWSGHAVGPSAASDDCPGQSYVFVGRIVASADSVTDEAKAS